MDNPKKIIEKAFEKFNEAQKKDTIGATFKHDGKDIKIPKSIIDLVMDLNPKDDEKREAITKELFKDEKSN